MKIGFIGTGNMGTAIIKGYIGDDLNKGSQIIAFDKDTKKLDVLKDAYNISVCSTSKEVVQEADIVILAVKPNIYETVLKEIRPEVSKDQLIVSIAAGISIAFMQQIIGIDTKVVRTMPNTPALVGEGMTAVSFCDLVTNEDQQKVLDIFKIIGKTEIVDEGLMDVVTGVSGSSPAYVYMFIEALADGAVLNGMAREQAYQFAAQAVLGSAKVVLESGEHPGKLKDQVCSPGGTTIEAVSVLEENGFRNAVIKAVNKCTDKSKQMKK